MKDNQDGTTNEQWSVTENKDRDFIKVNLDSPELESVEIERARRVKSRNTVKCPIIVKFNKYKDCTSILEKARELLKGDCGFSIQPDYTERVKTARPRTWKNHDTGERER